MLSRIAVISPLSSGRVAEGGMECRGIRQKEFAKKFDFSYSAMNETLNAKCPITTEFALLLKAALGINADLLVRIQTDYNIRVALERITPCAKS